MPFDNLYALGLDGNAQARGAALLAPVAAAYATYLAAHPEVTPAVINVAYVYTGAVGVGLNRWRAPSLRAPSYPAGAPPDVPRVAWFVPSVGSGVQNINVSISPYDLARANAFLAALGGAPTIANVLGRACCTGLAMLSGVDLDQGPWSQS